MFRLQAIIAGTCLALSAIPAQAADWTIDPAKSHLGFTGTQTGSAFTGRFSTFSGTISFDPAHPETGHGHVVIDTASAATGDRQRDGAIPGADWFDVAKYPQAVFDITGFAHGAGDEYTAHGTLTIKGRTQPETLPFTLSIDGDTAHARGHLDLVRTLFGIGTGPWASGQWVATGVGVDLDIAAHKAP